MIEYDRHLNMLNEFNAFSTYISTKEKRSLSLEVTSMQAQISLCSSLWNKCN